jgi:threonine synthase
MDRQADGAPIGSFVVASNANDILTRFFNDNDMTHPPVMPSLSPSMDIQVSSNFERLLFEINGRDGGLTTEQLQRFRRAVAVDRSRPAKPVHRRVFIAGRIDDDETIDVIDASYRDRHARRSAHRGAARRRRAPAVIDSRADRDDGDGAPRQVSRRRRTGNRHQAAHFRPQLAI